MKKDAYIFTVLIIITVSLVLLFVLRINKNTVNDKIIEYIDENCDVNNTCIFSMDDIVDFKWSKLIMYRIGSSEKE